VGRTLWAGAPRVYFDVVLPLKWPSLAMHGWFEELAGARRASLS